MPAGGALTTVPARVRQSDGWASVCAALRGGHSGTVDGAWGSAGAAAVAALAFEKPPVLLAVVPSLLDAAAWAEDLTSFLGKRPDSFPALESYPPVSVKGKLPPELAARLRIVQSLAAGPAAGTVVVAPMAAVLQPVPERADLAGRGRTVAVGDVLDAFDLLDWLAANGYKRVESVEYPGEFSKRGGILDVYPPDQPDPFRVELFGDEVESIRVFAGASQRSLGTRPSVTLMAHLDPKAQGRPSLGFLGDYLPPGSWIALIEPADLKEQAKLYWDRVADRTGLMTAEGAFAGLYRFPNVAVTAMPRASVEATCHLRATSVERFSGNVARIRDELDNVAGTDEVLVACNTEAEVHRLTEVLKAGKLGESGRLKLVTGHVRNGFRLVGGGAVVLGSQQLFHREAVAPGTKEAAKAGDRKVESRAIDTFLDLRDGDYVVHIAHGIARFRGMKMLEKSRVAELASRNEVPDDDELRNPTAAFEEHLILEFRDGVFLYVPASRIDMVQKYVGGKDAQPELSKLGGSAWARKKDKVTEAVRDMAADMIQVQAVRNAVTCEPMPPDSDWQAEFEGAFPYQETPDQISAIRDTKHDLERGKPMDRLICGDVGYGKTEVAIRAAFKAADNGKQVALLVPTTVLAEQHFRTFSQRFAEYPFVVECLNRFRSAGQIRDNLKRLADGEVDVVIGTHRLVSKDVKFKELGLVIIDEEQRFGVEHKERLKHLRATVPVLTMTATPIPRTLHSALLGIREISNLETPPADRQPVETHIIRWDDQLLRHAIHRELSRGGQVYFVHNRIYDLLDVAAKIKHLVPDARIAVGHGQMPGEQLEQAMLQFVRKDADILVSTTIIESGLDIPNANTIFIDDADQYGLADLHQLRGRVGRSSHRAYAYLIVDPLKLVNPQAQKRLKAIEEFTELGAGFKIAMRDLEIRGAGNILGTEQSGHIAAVGYEMYCSLLENAVRQMKQLPPRVPVEVNIDLPWPAYLPRDYVPGQKLRIEVYRRLARLRDHKALNDFRTELRDRYGKPPEAAEWLLKTTEVRLDCVKWQIAGVHRDGRDLIFRYRDRKLADGVAQRSAGRAKVVDEKSIYLRLKPEDDSPAAMYALLRKVFG